MSRLLVLITCLCFSCRGRDNIEFELNKNKYEKIIQCAYKHYSQVFSLSTSNSSASIYNAQRNKNEFCLEAINGIEKNNIEIISLDRDSSVAIYFKATPGFKTKQMGLLYSKSSNEISLKDNGEFRIIDKKSGGWYVFEKIISLAD